MTLYAVIAGIIAVIAAIVGAFAKGTRYGQNSATAKKAKDDEKLRKEFDRIDAGQPDVNASFDRLSDRAKRNAGTKAK